MNSPNSTISPTNSPQTSDGAVYTSDDGSKGTNYTVGFGVEESVSVLSPMFYLSIIWCFYLILIVALVFLIVIHRFERKKEQMEQVDVENVEEASLPGKNSPGRISKRLGLAIMVIANSLALVMAIYSILTCDFMSFNDPLHITVTYDQNFGNLKLATNRDDLSMKPATIDNIGLWSSDLSSTSGVLDRDGQCVHNSGLLFLDWPYRLARASVIIATLVGGICLIRLIWCCLKPEIRPSIRNLMWPFLIATIFQLLTIVLYESFYCDFEVCDPSSGAFTSITAALFWVYNACAARLLPFN
jgi:hypothetical protein